MPANKIGRVRRCARASRADHAATESVIARGIPVMRSNSLRVFAAAMPASWLSWAVLGDRFVGVTGHLPSEHLVDTAARQPSTALEIDLVVVLDELSRVLLEKLTDDVLHVAGSYRRVASSNTRRSAERESSVQCSPNDALGLGVRPTHCATPCCSPLTHHFRAASLRPSRRIAGSTGCRDTDTSPPWRRPARRHPLRPRIRPRNP